MFKSQAKISANSMAIVDDNFLQAGLHIVKLEIIVAGDRRDA
jgi:hypothetical protein